jgi:hypothetical protein
VYEHYQNFSLSAESLDEPETVLSVPLRKRRFTTARHSLWNNSNRLIFSVEAATLLKFWTRLLTGVQDRSVTTGEKQKLWTAHFIYVLFLKKVGNVRVT